MSDTVKTTCFYHPCSNIKAFELGDIDNELYQYDQQNRLEALTYLVHKEEIVVELEPIYAFCYHKPIQELQPTFMILPDGSEVQLEEEDVIDYGISIE